MAVYTTYQNQWYHLGKIPSCVVGNFVFTGFHLWVYQNSGELHQPRTSTGLRRFFQWLSGAVFVGEQFCSHRNFYFLADQKSSSSLHHGNFSLFCFLLCFREFGLVQSARKFGLLCTENRDANPLPTTAQRNSGHP